MIKPRVIPVLLLRDESLVKTIRFKSFTYVGDPTNTVRIFNELEVDEIMFLDILATTKNREPNLNVLTDIANECFMPLGYGGGIKSIDHAKQIFDIGFEKIVINTQAVENPALIGEIAGLFGSQAVVASIDVKKGLFGQQTVRTRGGTRNTHLNPVRWAKEVERMGAGEILLTSIDREGTWSGYDLGLVKQVADSVEIPVIANGGAGATEDISNVVNQANASAVALGSIVVFQQRGMGVLIHMPECANLHAETT
jgi:cyclase